MRGKNKPGWPTKKAKYLHIELYDLHLWFFKDRDIMAQAYNYLNCSKDSLDGDLGRASWVYNSEENKVLFLIGVFDDSLNTLVHEIAHISSYMLQQVNIPLEAANSEPLAYLQEHLFNKLKSKINTKKKGNS